MRTVMVHGSDGEVMVHIGGGTFIPGKRQTVLVTGLSADESTPLVVREALIGMEVSTLFSKKQLGNPPEMQDGARGAPVDELIEKLAEENKREAAQELERMVREEDALVYILEPAIFESIQTEVMATC